MSGFIGIIDYNAGNLFSVQNALNFLGVDNRIVKNRYEIERASALILPGVGAFGDAMKKLNDADLVGVIKEQAKSKPLLGICLGMQILFDKGFEYGEHEGLSLITGEVQKMSPKGLAIPHMGWNLLHSNYNCKLMKGLSSSNYVYFVHSYMAVCDDYVVAEYCNYGNKIPAIVVCDNVYGIQFHPEKSGDIGLQILKNFADLMERI